MKVPLSWLKDYVDITLPPIEIAKMLTMAGLEVDAIDTIDLGFTHVVVGEVIETEPHPNADKLCLAKVNDGTDIHHVVCGAPNCRPGIKTALAKVGALLPDEGEKPFKVKKSKIRGCESLGMLCSWKELKISDDNEGIIEFGEGVEIGANVAEIFQDSVFEISLTPNLGHCANLIGVARELHASTEEPLHLPNVKVKENDNEKIEGQVVVQVKDATLCPRYACRLIKNVKIEPSPQWMQNRLISSGIRPVNNIVDITNYVLLEMGHPLHAFDYDQLDGNEIIVRSASEGEKFVTLDEKERSLPKDALLICDGKKPVAIAGIMGGQNSEVSIETKNILLESAYFAPSSIRRTSKKLGLMTDASRRFERGSDPNMVEIALNRASMLMHEIASGEIVKGIIDIKESEFEEKIVDCRVSRANKILGTQLSVGEVESIFQRLGFSFTWDSEDTFNVTIPTYRVDISQEVDLIEEIARLFGFDNLHKPISAFHNSKMPHSEVFLFEREIRARMVSEGLQEFMTCDLIGPSLLEIVHGSLMDKESLVEVLNPTSIEQSCLRTSLLPGILQVVQYNCDRQNSDIAGFEIGRIHFKKGVDKYHEETVVGLVMTGKVDPHNWGEKSREVDFYDIKGVIENMLEEYGINDCIYKNNKLSFFHTGRQASVYVGSLELGTLGEIHPAITRRLGMSQRIFFAEFNLEDIFKCRCDSHQMKPIPVYPSSERDWTMTMREKTPMSDVFSIINSIDSRLLEECQVRDIYRSEKLGDGLKNVTLRFVYRDKKKTVSQEVVDREHARITDKTRSLITS